MRMADEVRVFAARRGVDLTSFTLLPFGGAGAVHAAAVAEELGMRRILVPPRPGAFSALGLLCTDVVHDYIRSELTPLAALDAAHAEAIFRAIEAKARDGARRRRAHAADAEFARELDLRYAGQGYELRMPLAGLWHERARRRSRSPPRARASTSATPRSTATRRASRPVEVVSYRLRVRVAVPNFKPRRARADSGGVRPDAAPQGHAHGLFRRRDGDRRRSLYEREKLDVGATLAGPAIVEQFDATTVVPPGWRARVDRHRNLVLSEGVSMDAITIQVLRNRIASLMEEMHYHFYRSGYSTIIRESRDFSCVILDRDRRA